MKRNIKIHLLWILIVQMAQPVAVFAGGELVIDENLNALNKEIEKLSENIKTQNDIINEKIEQIEEYERICEASLQALASNKNKIDDLRKEKTKLEEDAKQNTEKFTNIEKNLEDAEKQKSEIEKQLAEEKEKLAEEKKKRSAVVEKLQSTEKAMGELNNRLQNQLINAEKQKSEIEKKLTEEHKKKMEELITKLQVEHRKVLDILQRTLKTKNTECQALITTIEQLRVASRTQQGDNATLQDELQKIKNDQSKEKIQKIETIETIKNLEIQMAQETEKSSALHKELQAKETELQAAQKELQASTENMDGITQGLKTELKAKETELKAKETELKVKETELNTKETELEAATKKMHTLKREQNNAIAQRKGLSTELELEKTEFQNYKQKSENEIKQKQNIIKELEQTITNSKIINKKLEENKGSLKEIIKQLTQKNQNLKKEITDLKEKIPEIQKKAVEEDKRSRQERLSLSPQTDLSFFGYTPNNFAEPPGSQSQHPEDFHNELQSWKPIFFVLGKTEQEITDGVHDIDTLHIWEQQAVKYMESKLQVDYPFNADIKTLLSNQAHRPLLERAQNLAHVFVNEWKPVSLATGKTEQEIEDSLRDVNVFLDFQKKIMTDLRQKVNTKWQVFWQLGRKLNATEYDQDVKKKIVLFLENVEEQYPNTFKQLIEISKDPITAEHANALLDAEKQIEVLIEKARHLTEEGDRSYSQTQKDTKPIQNENSGHGTSSNHQTVAVENHKEIQEVKHQQGTLKKPNTLTSDRPVNPSGQQPGRQSPNLQDFQKQVSAWEPIFSVLSAKDFEKVKKGFREDRERRPEAHIKENAPLQRSATDELENTGVFKKCAALNAVKEQIVKENRDISFDNRHLRKNKEEIEANQKHAICKQQLEDLRQWRNIFLDAGVSLQEIEDLIKEGNEDALSKKKKNFLKELLTQLRTVVDIKRKVSKDFAESDLYKKPISSLLMRTVDTHGVDAEYAHQLISATQKVKHLLDEQFVKELEVWKKFFNENKTLIGKLEHIDGLKSANKISGYSDINEFVKILEEKITNTLQTEGWPSIFNLEFKDLLLDKSLTIDYVKKLVAFLQRVEEQVKKKSINVEQNKKIEKNVLLETKKSSPLHTPFSQGALEKQIKDPKKSEVDQVKKESVGSTVVSKNDAQKTEDFTPEFNEKFDQWAPLFAKAGVIINPYPGLIINPSPIADRRGWNFNDFTPPNSYEYRISAPSYPLKRGFSMIPLQDPDAVKKEMFDIYKKQNEPRLNVTISKKSFEKTALGEIKRHLDSLKEENNKLKNHFNKIIQCLQAGSTTEQKGDLEKVNNITSAFFQRERELQSGIKDQLSNLWNRASGNKPEELEEAQKLAPQFKSYDELLKLGKEADEKIQKESNLSVSLRLCILGKGS